MATDHEPKTINPDDPEWAFEVRPQCFRCDRLAVVYDDEDRPLCGRHGTIFMTANKAHPETPDRR